MADVAGLGSDVESDGLESSSSGGGVSGGTSTAQGDRDGNDGVAGASRDPLTMRLESLQQENRVLRMELDTLRYRCRGLEAENLELKKARVDIQMVAEQQEEYISNMLLKKIEALKNEKEQLARNYEQEEEFLTNELSRKLVQLRSEKTELEGTMAREQEQQMEKLLKHIDRLQAEVSAKQATLEQLKRDKVELENQLEQEQEALVNRLWKRMDKLEAEKRMLQEKLDEPISAPPSPRRSQPMCVGDSSGATDVAGSLIQNISTLKNEVARLQAQLRMAQTEHKETMARYAEEERHIRQENVRLQRKLQMEIERREQLCRRLSESESSIEIDEERHFNEMTKRSSLGDVPMSRSSSVPSPSPVPYSPAVTRPLSPGLMFGVSPLGMASPRPIPSSASVYHHYQSAHMLPLAPLSSSTPSISCLSSVFALTQQKSHEKFVMPSATGTIHQHMVTGELAK